MHGASGSGTVPHKQGGKSEGSERTSQRDKSKKEEKSSRNSQAGSPSQHSTPRPLQETDITRASRRRPLRAAVQSPGQGGCAGTVLGWLLVRAPPDALMLWSVYLQCCPRGQRLEGQMDTPGRQGNRSCCLPCLPLAPQGLNMGPFQVQDPRPMCPEASWSQPVPFPCLPQTVLSQTLQPSLLSFVPAAMKSW